MHVAQLDITVTSTSKEPLHNKALDLLLTDYSDITVVVFCQHYKSSQSIVIMTAVLTVILELNLGCRLMTSLHIHCCFGT